MRHGPPDAETALFVTVVDNHGRCYHLTAEPLPTEQDWDWAAWRSGDARGALHGRAPSGTAAMAAAKKAIFSHFYRRIGARAA